VSPEVRRISRLDAAARRRIEAACGFINAEIRRYRGITLVWLFGVTAVAVVTLILGVDIRIIGGGAMVIMLVVTTACHNALKKSYKGLVLPRVVKALGDGLSYSAESSLTKEDFLSMDMFSRLVESWNSEDEISGRVGDVSYAMHECYATRTEGSGKNRRTVTIFRGVITRLDFNKNFVGHTVVVPNSESQILGGLFGESDSRRGKTLSRMENPEFEDEFSVYSSNDQQARYILTPKLMELILAARNRLETSVRLAFLGNSVFLAVSDSTNRFEAPLFGSVSPENAMGEFIECIELAESLVKTLDLETRIWSRV
jgi:hypothetical protein